MKGFPVRPTSGESVGEAAKAAARRRVEQVRVGAPRAQPTAVYIARLTATAVFAYLLALQLPGDSSRSVLAPLTALLVVQATLYHTIRSAVQRVVGVTAGVTAAVVVAAYVPFSWWVLGLLIAGTLGLGMLLRLREDILEVPISAMLIFSVDSHAAATSRITETLVGAAAGLAAGLLFAPLRVQPAKEAVGDLSRQMADLLGQMAAGLAEGADPKRATEWLGRTRALRGESERVDDALSQAEESVRLNPRRLRFVNPAAGLRDGVDTLERAATDMRVLARSVADSARIDSEHSPMREAETRGRLGAVLAELSAAVRAYGQLLEAEPVAAEGAGNFGHFGHFGPFGHGGLAGFAGLAGLAGLAGREGRPGQASFATEPLTEVLEDHLEEAGRQQDRLADLLQADPAAQPEGSPLRGEIHAHVDRLGSGLQ